MINKLRKSRAAGFWHGATFVSFAWFAANEFAREQVDAGCVLGFFAVGTLALHLWLNWFASDARWEEAFSEQRHL